MIEAGVRERPVPDIFRASRELMVPLDGDELIVGSSIDPEFGPGAVIRLGGQLGGGEQDRGAPIAPAQHHPRAAHDGADPDLHRVQGARGGKPVPLAELDQLMARFSRLVIEQPWIKEIESTRLTRIFGTVRRAAWRVIVHGARWSQVGRGPPSVPIQCNTSSNDN